MIEILNSPWKKCFYENIKSSLDNIKICVPFIKYDVVKEIYKHKNGKVKLDLITNINLASFYKKASDIEAIEFALDNKDRVNNYQSLHAKIYIFDDKKVIITSANLTNSGLEHNYEYGIITNEEHIVKKACCDYKKMINNEICDSISKRNVDDIKRILNKIPSGLEISFPKIDINNTQDEKLSQEELFDIDLEIIEESLQGWNLLVFLKIKEIDKQVIKLSEIYNYTNQFKEIYPNNLYIKAKIRQTMQNLRNIGLIKFLGNGTYQKMWRQVNF